MVTALREAGFTNWQVGHGHEVTPSIKSLLVRLPRPGRGRTVQQQLSRLLDSNTRAGISSLESLAPRWPAPGGSPRRNTEYPFHDAEGEWTYPAAEGVFLAEEVEAFRALAHRVLWGVERILSAIRRVPQ